MDTQIVINWPRHHNLPTEPGWYLAESPLGNYTSFLYVGFVINQLRVVVAGQKTLDSEELFRYVNWKWSDKIDL